MAQTPAPLEHRIKAIRAEIDALIDAHAAAVAADCPGVPLAVVRHSIVGNDGGCQCEAYTRLAEKGLL